MKATPEDLKELGLLADSGADSTRISSQASCIKLEGKGREEGGEVGKVGSSKKELGKVKETDTLKESPVPAPAISTPAADDQTANPQSKDTTIRQDQLTLDSLARYPGDLREEADIPLEQSGYRALNFESPPELIAFFDQYINSGVVTLYPWQLEIGEELAKAKPNNKHPYKFCLCAANGSGKDAYVIAPFTVWFALCKVQSLCIITSASCQQLNSQTENYIKRLCEAVNKFYQQPIFRIRQRFIKCTLTGSEVRLFATDEAGKAEGYHPLTPVSEMAIIVNEAKSVSQEIFGALRRCTGYNYWLNVSTPGEPNGEFYKSFQNWPNKRRVTYHDCLEHQSAEEYEEDKKELGEWSFLFRSKWLALFTTVGGNVVVSQIAIDKWKETVVEPKFKWWPKRIGIDLAAGGDECVISVWQGTRRIEQFTFREKDTTVSAILIAGFLKKHVEKDHDYIRADDGGVGRSIIDMLVRMGWNIKRVLNQSPAKRKGEFRNRGAEMWFKVARLIEECCIECPVEDEKLLLQLGQRYYKKAEGQGGITLQSKPAAKAEGRPSPDRADAMVLALYDLTVDDFTVPDAPKKTEKKRVGLGNNPQEAYMDLVFAGKDEMVNRNSGDKFKNSLSVYLSNKEYRDN